MGKRKTNIDMLSRLPDEVLCHILSFLPTKLSVCTSVLSIRWRFLWAHVPNLEFHGYHYSSKTLDLYIIIRVIMLHEAKTVNTFNLSLSNVKKGCAYLLETLIIYPLKRGVRNLSLELYFKLGCYIVCTLPRLLFTSKTLVDLKLDFYGVIPSTGEMFLPSLKKLNLINVVYESDQSLPHLLSGCPVLEKLIVDVYFRDGQKNSGCVIVSSPTIKKLIVDFSQLDDEYFPVEMLIIDVPALVYLKVNYCDLERVKSLRKTMTSLIEVEIILSQDWHDCDTDCTEHGRSIEFLSCLSRVTHLNFRSDCYETTLHLVGTCSMPKFVNLTKLKLDLTVYWFDLVKFLKVADNLEVLIISLHGMPSYKEPERVPPCMLSRLRTVRMLCFSAYENGFDMVRYILKNAQVLETMKISPLHNSSDKENLDVLRRISMFERGSKSCQLDFNTV